MPTSTTITTMKAMRMRAALRLPAGGASVDATFAGVIVLLVLAVFGIYVGFHIGCEMAKDVVTKQEYWQANAKIILVGIVASAVIYATGLVMLVGVPVGGMAGAMTGLKMDFGESVGPWKFVDTTFRVNKDQVRRAKNPEHAEAVRRARRDGTPEPEMMSVEDPDQEGKDAAGSQGGSRQGSGKSRAKSGKRKNGR